MKPITREQEAVMNELAKKAAEETVDAAYEKFEAVLIAKVVPEAVKATMKSMGIDADNMPATQDKFRYLDKIYKRSEKRYAYIVSAAWTAGITSTVVAIFAYFKPGP